MSDMKYKEIEDIFSAKRMQKYVMACGGDTRRAMTLYRYNLKLSQEMYTLISCFEVALRNRIDKQMVDHLGNIGCVTLLCQEETFIVTVA